MLQNESGAKYKRKTGSCKENWQKLHMSTVTCIEKSNFLYMTQNEIRN